MACLPTPEESNHYHNLSKLFTSDITFDASIVPYSRCQISLNGEVPDVMSCCGGEGHKHEGVTND